MSGPGPLGDAVPLLPDVGATLAGFAVGWLAADLAAHARTLWRGLLLMAALAAAMAGPAALADIALAWLAAAGLGLGALGLALDRKRRAMLTLLKQSSG